MVRWMETLWMGMEMSVLQDSGLVAKNRFFWIYFSLRIESGAHGKDMGSRIMLVKSFWKIQANLLVVMDVEVDQRETRYYMV